MTEATDILTLAARDIDSDAISLIIFFVIMGISVLAKLGERWLQRYAARRKQEQLARDTAQGRHRPEPRPHADQQPQPQARPQPQPDFLVEEEPVLLEPDEYRDLPAAPPHHEPKADRTRRMRQEMLAARMEVLRRRQEALQASVPLPQPVRQQVAPVPAPKPLTSISPAPKPAAPASTGRVEQEIARLQQRLSRLEQVRTQRLGTLAAREAKFGSRLAAVRPDADAAVKPVVAVGVDLGDRQLARSAIIFHEIFSAPKALREGAEMWDA